MENTPNLLPVKLFIQNQNGPKWNELLRKLTDYLTIPIDQFYTDYFDLRTCTKQGLDNWGRILNVGRTVPYFNIDSIFGFDTGVTPSPPDTGYPQNFDHGNFYALADNTFELNDNQYRVLLQFTYINQTIDNSIGACVASVNAYARNSHDGDSSFKCQVIESALSFTYAFNYTLEGWEAILFAVIKILPTPAGIPYTVTWIT